jgi:hypothetical protein
VVRTRSNPASAFTEPASTCSPGPRGTGTLSPVTGLSPGAELPSTISHRREHGPRAGFARCPQQAGGPREFRRLACGSPRRAVRESGRPGRGCPGEISRLRKTGQSSRRVAIIAPTDGVVIAKPVQQGMKDQCGRRTLPDRGRWSSSGTRGSSGSPTVSVHCGPSIWVADQNPPAVVMPQPSCLHSGSPAEMASAKSRLAALDICQRPAAAENSRYQRVSGNRGTFRKLVSSGLS